MACQDIGEANPDIAGIGILLAFAIQGAIAVVLSIYSLFVGRTWQGEVILESHGMLSRLDSTARRVVQIMVQIIKGSASQRTDKGLRKQKLVNEILVAGSDMQSWSGIALLIAAFVQIRTISLYQLHIIYDTASFVAISNCAAIAITYGPFGIKHLVMIIWSLLYLGFTIVFGIRLRSWNDDIPGQCYITSGIAAPGNEHPYVDHIYISITCLYVISSLYAALGLNSSKIMDFNSKTYRDRILSATDAIDRRLRQHLSPEYLELLNKAIPLLRLDPTFSEDPDAKQTVALLIALIQYPVHTYSVFMIRAMNESHLAQGSTEQDWGFGQVVAITLLGSNIVMLFEGISRYRREVTIATN